MLPIIFIFLIFYNIAFNPSHPHRIDCRVYRLHKKKLPTNKSQKHVCNSVQRRAHVYKTTVWKDDKIFKVNIYNGKNGCTHSKLLKLNTIWNPSINEHFLFTCPQFIISPYQAKWNKIRNPHQQFWPSSAIFHPQSHGRTIFRAPLNISSGMPPNSSRDPKVGPKMKQWKKKWVDANSLTQSTLRIGGYVGALGWD
jgi:hypothetical protein